MGIMIYLILLVSIWFYFWGFIYWYKSRNCRSIINNKNGKLFREMLHYKIALYDIISYGPIGYGIERNDIAVKVLEKYND